MSHGWIYGTVEWDENVKRDKTVEFVTWLNTCNCWIRYNVKRLEYWICYIVGYCLDCWLRYDSEIR